MKLRIGLLGNSHLAAFRLGWNEISHEYPDLDLIFFGAIKGLMTKFAVQNGQMVPTVDRAKESIAATSNGMTFIPGNFDAYLIVGLGYGLERLLINFRRHRPPRFNDAARYNLISEDFAIAGMQDYLANCQSMEVVGLLRQITSSPIYIVPSPYFSHDVLTDSGFVSWCGDVPLRNWVFDFYKSSVEDLSVRFPVIEQPQSTIVDSMFSKAEFCRGGVTLDQNFKNSKLTKKDYRHFNAEFGSVSLREVLDRNIIPRLKQQNAAMSVI